MNENGSGQPLSIYVMPTEEGLPPRAMLSREVMPGVLMPVSGVAYMDGAWRDPQGERVPEELEEAITSHAESLGVEWEH